MPPVSSCSLAGTIGLHTVHFAFYLSAFGILRMWQGVASARPVPRRQVWAAHAGVLFIASIFLNSYVSRVATMPAYWVWAAGMVVVVAAYLARTGAAPYRAERTDARRAHNSA